MGDLHEKIEAAKGEIAERFADVINDLGVKYNTPNGLDYLIAIARAYVLGEEQMYEADVEFDMGELIKLYAKYLALSLDSLNH